MVGSTTSEEDDDRLEQLEARLDDQERGLKKLLHRLPEDFGKRAFLSGMAGAGSMGALAGFGAGSAQAAEGLGTVGPQSNPLAGLYADGFNDGRSGRFGDIVYYDARDSGPYTDGADALADVPTGGTLRLAATTYDVATEGRLSTSTPVNVVGEGHSEDTNANTFNGTVIRNDGGDVINSPVIEISPTDRWHGGIIQNIAIVTEAASPTVLLDNLTYASVDNVHARGENTATQGLKVANSSFFFRCYRSRFVRFTDKAGWVENGPGSEHSFIDSHFGTDGAANNAIGLRTEREGTKIYGGQYGGGKTGGAAIQFYNPTSSSFEGGGHAENFLVETGEMGVEITGNNDRWNSVTVEQPRLPLDPTTVGVNEGIRFDLADNCQLIRPKFSRRSETGARWTTNARVCGVVSGHANLASTGFVDDGATSPYIAVPERLGNTRLSQLPTDVAVYVGMSRSNGDAPAWYDPVAGSWKFANSTNFTP